MTATPQVYSPETRVERVGDSDRLQRALVTLAYVVLRHGEVYAPLLARVEDEIAAARRGTPEEHARRVLESYTVDGGSNAILPSHDAFCSSVGPEPYLGR